MNLNRRDVIIKGTAAGLLALPLGGLTQELYKEGTHYQRLPQKVPTSTGDKIEVVEIFWYGCQHCFRFEPHIDAWLERKPDNVEFVHVPGAGGRWTIGAVAFYVGKKLGIIDQTHKAMFDHIHVDKVRVDTLDDVYAFYEGYGVSREEFDKAVDSFEVKTGVQRSMELMKRYQITGVPSLIVNGRYKTNSLDVVDYLIRKESAA